MAVEWYVSLLIEFTTMVRFNIHIHINILIDIHIIVNVNINININIPSVSKIRGSACCTLTWCCVILYRIVLFYIILYCIVLCCVVLSYFVLYCYILNCFISYCIALYCLISYWIVFYCVVPYRAMILIWCTVIKKIIVCYCVLGRYAFYELSDFFFIAVRHYKFLALVSPALTSSPFFPNHSYLSIFLFRDSHLLIMLLSCPTFKFNFSLRSIF